MSNPVSCIHVNSKEKFSENLHHWNKFSKSFFSVSVKESEFYSEKSPYFLPQIFATTRKFVRSTAPHRWSSPTPPTSTSAGTRCPMLSVGFAEPAKSPPPLFPSHPHATGLAGACRRYGNTMCGRGHLIGRCDVCVCVLWMQKANEKRANTRAHTQTRGAVCWKWKQATVKINIFILALT